MKIYAVEKKKVWMNLFKSIFLQWVFLAAFRGYFTRADFLNFVGLVFLENFYGEKTSWGNFCQSNSRNFRLNFYSKWCNPAGKYWETKWPSKYCSINKIVSWFWSYLMVFQLNVFGMYFCIGLYRGCSHSWIKAETLYTEKR